MSDSLKFALAGFFALLLSGWLTGMTVWSVAVSKNPNHVHGSGVDAALAVTCFGISMFLFMLSVVESKKS